MQLHKHTHTHTPTHTHISVLDTNINDSTDWVREKGPTKMPWIESRLLSLPPATAVCDCFECLRWIAKLSNRPKHSIYVPIVLSRDNYWSCKRHNLGAQTNKQTKNRPYSWMQPWAGCPGFSADELAERFCYECYFVFRYTLKVTRRTFVIYFTRNLDYF